MDKPTDLVLRIQTRGFRAWELRCDEERSNHRRTYRSELKGVLNSLGLPFPDDYIPRWDDDVIDCIYKGRRVDSVCATAHSHF